MPDLDNGYAWYPELFGRQNPSMSDDYLAPIVGHHRHHEAELLDGVGELIDLPLGMSPRVAGIQDEVCHRPVFNFNLDQPGVGRRVQFISHWWFALLRVS